MKGMMGLLILISSVLSFQVMAHTQIVVGGKQYTLTKEDFVHKTTGKNPVKHELIATFNVNGDHGQRLYFNLAGIIAGKVGLKQGTIRKVKVINVDTVREKVVEYTVPGKKYHFFDATVTLSCSNIAIDEDSVQYKKYLNGYESNNTSKINENKSSKIVVYKEQITKGKCKQLQVKITHQYNKVNATKSKEFHPMSIDNVHLTLSVLEKY
ncbi:hypothetical protein [uncultured Shewanella sp.]|uniref:hypothetical protein n=1 Tax=uncultured Shewanella sp. TaxID=173975 RepID=UPI00262A9C49|nr:hypothetical protein [uncultured Shewanella sp.]